MSTATLGGIPCTSARLSVPAWGVPYAECQLAEEATLSGRVDLVIADLTVSCTILSGAPTKGRSGYRVAAGAGAWGRSVPAKGYTNDAGVRRATVLQDAAEACGEALDLATIPSEPVGPQWTREAGPASLVLELLAPQNWYVGVDGLTRIGRRTGGTLPLDARVGELDAARASVEIASDQIAAILPGLVLDGRPVVDVEHSVGKQGLRSRAWFGTSGSRAADAMYRAIRKLFPWLRFSGTHEFRVVTLSGSRLNLQPVRVSSGMPDLRNVRMYPGVGGTLVEPALGSRVLVTWIDSDPARPTVVGFEDSEGEGFEPDSLAADVDGDIDVTGDVITLDGDRVVVGPTAATLVAAQPAIALGDGAPDASVTTAALATGRVVRYGDTVIISGAPVVLTAALIPSDPPAGLVSKVRA